MCQQKFWDFFKGESTRSSLHIIYWGDAVNSCELTAVVTAMANALACNLSNDELALLSAVLVQLGDTLVTISVQRSNRNEK